jgi:hypothetical protein
MSTEEMVQQTWVVTPEHLVHLLRISQMQASLMVSMTWPSKASSMFA